MATQRTIQRILGVAAAAWLLSACALLDSDVGTQLETLTPANVSIDVTTPAETTPTLIPIIDASSTPPEATAELTLPPLIRLRIWLPEPLAPVDNVVAAEMLYGQIAAFAAANRDIEIETRVKRPTDAGGIMATLRTASAVAPSALPDLTLMRRSDLLMAGEERLIQPLIDEGDAVDVAYAVLLDDMPPTVVSLGRIDDTLMGAPYLVDVQHMAYYPDFVSLEAWTFDAVIENGVPFTFPAGRGVGRSDTLTAQILAAGADIDADAFVRLLRFYERAAEAGLIDPLSLDISAPSEYRARLANGEIRAGIVSSGDALALLAGGADIAVAPLPTEEGRAVAPLDGWIWVTTTTDSARATVVRQLIEWLFNVERHADYSRAVALLPSTRTALRTWEGEYATFAEALLNNAVLPENLPAATTRAMHTALIAVLTGESTAEQAAQEVFAQIGVS
ncbi:MAG: extracellular solute-binding protein [Chloroflexota bacterium]|nr:extracellular solute-binding protein [Chloroflexota bacterium]